nr:hypothetical protein [uncultured Kingella sp.]
MIANDFLREQCFQAAFIAWQGSLKAAGFNGVSAKLKRVFKLVLTARRFSNEFSGCLNAGANAKAA